MNNRQLVVFRVTLWVIAGLLMLLLGLPMITSNVDGFGVLVGLALPVLLIGASFFPMNAAGGHDSRKCPHCAELVSREAKVCRHCGKDLPPKPTEHRYSWQQD